MMKDVRNSQVEDSLFSEARNAIVLGDAGVLETLVRSGGLSVDYRNHARMQIVHVVAAYGTPEELVFVVEEGCAKGVSLLEVRDVDGMRPIHYAASAGRLDMVKILYDMGADIKALDSQGNTTLGLVRSACEHGWAHNRFQSYLAVERYLRTCWDTKPVWLPVSSQGLVQSCKPR